MIYYTNNNKDLIFNKAREKAYTALLETLDFLYGKDNISELDFKKLWLSNISNRNNVIAQGWYNPPIDGMAVLSDDKLNFDSLRNEEFFSDNTIIDWNNGYLYAYCSPVEKSDGYIGDMSITLYFGKDERVIEHFKNVRKAIQDIFDNLEIFNSPKDLYNYSLDVFKNHHLVSNVISRTDNMPSNLGHTFTHLDNAENKEMLNENDIKYLSTNRQFINVQADWKFIDGIQFTIEPQLLSLDNPDLYKVTHHYVAKKVEDGFIICNDIDYLLDRYGLK